MTGPRIAIIAGERSGDLLAAGLIGSLQQNHDEPLELVGVGGPALQARGLTSLFDYSELSLMGFAAVLARLPRLIARIGQTAKAIIASNPDCLIIVDSPDFTHRVARRVKRALPDLPVINYVCPTVWAWKPGRAAKMRAYVDHVLAVFPFEPEIVARLGGPPLTYVGHRLMRDEGLLEARKAQLARQSAIGDGAEDERTCLLLPGSRRSEIRNLAGDFSRSAQELSRLDRQVRFVLPVAPGREEMVRNAVADWPVEVELVIGEDAKWAAFGRADVAIAASGTVLLELALARIPAISLYRVDFIASFFLRLITTWSAALPNLIADRVVTQEFYQNWIKPGRVARLARQLMTDKLTRQAVLADLDRVYDTMQVSRPPEENAASIVAGLLSSQTK